MLDKNKDAAVLQLMVNRFGYGPRPEDAPKLAKLDAYAWLDDQLAAPSGDNAETAARLAAVKLPIKYDASENKWPAVDEMRPLSSLSLPIGDLWAPLFDPQKPKSSVERAQPRLETIAATLTRSVYSPFQLREVMAQFWHDHFHVNAFSAEQIAVALPAYDRDVIRKHSFGNFREMLEAVAASAAMQYYLSNHSSRAGAANENYARELFELHTLGRDAYLNDQYDRWREVPGAVEGKPQGYIDQDVYEAARAFTGWTIEDGANIDGGRKLPLTGKFVYVENWHDGYQKRVLATEFDPFARPMLDGSKVLDLVAAHPATARHMAAKLCNRLAGPSMPDAFVAKVADAWMQFQNAPDQIAQIIRLIGRSDEFANSAGGKVKRPLALMAGYVRIMGYDFSPTQGVIGQLSNAGQPLFGAPTPAGLPDRNEIFLGSNAMRQRWQLLLGLAQNYWQTGIPRPDGTLQQWGKRAARPDDYAVDFLELFGNADGAKLAANVTIAAGLVPFAPPAGEDGEKHLAIASAIAAMSPSFQTC